MNEFLAGFWVFIGIVAGAIIQYILNKISQREARKIALKILKTEIIINLEACKSLRQRLSYIRERVGARQISETDLFITMQDFDYSSIGVLASNGLLHTILGPELTQKYFSISRQYNNNSAIICSDMLRNEHAKEKSLDYIKWLTDKLDKDEEFLVSLKEARIVGGVATVALPLRK